MADPHPPTWQPFALTQEACHPFQSSVPPKQPEAPLHAVSPAPPWRQFMEATEFNDVHGEEAFKRWQIVNDTPNSAAREKANSFVLPDIAPCRELVLAVNAALALRRPLLLTGLPGSGKSTLAYVVAEWLRLGPVLEWNISPGATLADALSTYNPLARLQDLERANKLGTNPQPVERFIRLGPVGTAFLPGFLPRVLLIDEIDKGDLNLANELLHLFENGKFPIPELQRADREATGPQTTADQVESPGQAGREVDTWDENKSGQPVPAKIHGGVVRCHEFPLVVMSSNGEREFPPAFHRRCLRVTMPNFSANPDILETIVRSHLARDGQTLHQVSDALAAFDRARRAAASRNDSLAMDQLLNLAFLMERSPSDLALSLERVLLQSLNSDLEELQGAP
jgi:MoxR-like ATPase